MASELAQALAVLQRLESGQNKLATDVAALSTRVYAIESGKVQTPESGKVQTPESGKVAAKRGRKPLTVGALKVANKRVDILDKAGNFVYSVEIDKDNNPIDGTISRLSADEHKAGKMAASPVKVDYTKLTTLEQLEKLAESNVDMHGQSGITGELCGTDIHLVKITDGDTSTCNMWAVQFEMDITLPGGTVLKNVPFVGGVACESVRLGGNANTASSPLGHAGRYATVILPGHHVVNGQLCETHTKFRLKPYVSEALDAKIPAGKQDSAPFRNAPESRRIAGIYNGKAGHQG